MIHPRLVARPLRQCIRCAYSTAPPTSTATPPLLVKLRNDMKTAMKARDSSRLDVLRGLIAETTNAAKSSNPVTTDSHMLSIIRKRVKSSETAVGEFESAKRDDLRDKELKQIAILQSYVDESNVMREDDLTAAIQQVVGQMRTEGKKTDKGSVMKSLVGPGGALDGQLVDKKDVARVVDGMI